MQKAIKKIRTLAPWASDAGALYVRKIVTTVLPFLMLPFISRVLDEIEFSRYLFYQSVFIFGLLLTDYGFNLTAVRDLARCLSPEEAKDKVARVVAAKMIIFLPVLLAVVLVSIFAGAPLADSTTICAVVFLALSENLNPNWYLHGRNRIKMSTWMEVLIYIFTLVWVFVLLSNFDMAATIFFGMGLIRFAIFGWFWAGYRRRNGNLKVSIQQGWEELKQGVDVFLFRLASAFYNRGNTIALSLLGTPLDVIKYAGAEKISKGAGGLVSPLSQAFFPRAAGKASDGYVKFDFQHAVYFSLGFGLMILVSFALFVLRIPLSTFLFGQYATGVSSALAILAFLPAIIFLSNYFGIHILLNTGAQRTFSRIIISASLVHALIIIPAALIGKANGVAGAWLFTECMVSVLMIFFGSRRIKLTYR